MSKNYNLSLIVAKAQNGVIGKDNDLPWRLPNDLKYFKETTRNKPVIMGRKTFDSIGRALPERTNIVVTRDSSRQYSDVSLVNSLQEALELAAKSSEGELMLIGGAELYSQALGIANRIYMTEVKADVDGDAKFPELPEDEWREISRMSNEADQKNEYPHDFVVFDKVR